MNPSEAVRIGRARGMMADGRPDLAVNLLINRQDPDRPCAEAHFFAGCAYFELLDFDQARHAFHCYLKRVPSDDLGARVHLDRLNRGPPAQLPASYVRLLFDQYADRFDDHLLNRLNYRTPRHLATALRKVRGRRAGGGLDVLDIGCGTGLAGARFRDNARFLAGVDLSPRMIAKARDKKLYDQLRVGGAEPLLNQSPNAWDLVVAADMLIYVGNLTLLLAAVARALRPGGHFVASIECGDELDFELQMSKRFAHRPAYVAAAAHAAGLSVVLSRKHVPRRERQKRVAGMILVMRLALSSG
jgi:predicted TPR repeat methyltransferase